MNGWAFFWTISLILAGSSFAMITALVTVRGWRDLREMLSDLSKQRDGGA
jgi:hypothetical protein